MSNLSILAARVEPELLDLPWDIELDTWPTHLVAALPRGISRHTVRFVHLRNRIIAVKEISENIAVREYNLLRRLHNLGAPSVAPIAVVSRRTTLSGEPLNACLVTEHLSFSLPFRAVFGQRHQDSVVSLLIDALVGLMVRLHLLGFFWGDVSLSNVLFRRDAGSFAAYLVDAETGELHKPITTRKREYDIDVARTNIIGELMDLQAGEILPADFDTLSIGNVFAHRYHELWNVLDAPITFGQDEEWKIATRIERLNQLGFDVNEMDITQDSATQGLRMRPKTVEPRFYSLKVERLTGLVMEENQARRILNDIEEFSSKERERGQTSEQAAQDWVREVYQPTIDAIPLNLRDKLEPAEVFHELLDHRWFISEQQKREVPQAEAVTSFIDNVLRHRRDESTFFDDGR